MGPVWQLTDNSQIRSLGSRTLFGRSGYAEKIDPLDEVIEDKGVRVLIDPKAVLFLLGAEMDYKVEKLSAPVHLQQSEPDGGVPLRRIGPVPACERSVVARAISQ